jgi:DNA-binding MarR family transcriptional regulator
MNAKRPNSQDHYKSLLLLQEISQDNSLSQRDLSRRLNIALGLVNSYMKNMVARGFVKIRGIPAKRYVYYLTPQGFAEKTRLTLQVLRSYADLYRHARRDFTRLFGTLTSEGKKALVFAGADELAEIAFLSLQETPAELMMIVDDGRAGDTFLGRKVAPVATLRGTAYDAVVITSLGEVADIIAVLEEAGVPQEDIYHVDSWLPARSEEGDTDVGGEE